MQAPSTTQSRQPRRGGVRPDLSPALSALAEQLRKRPAPPPPGPFGLQGPGLGLASINAETLAALSIERTMGSKLLTF